LQTISTVILIGSFKSVSIVICKLWTVTRKNGNTENTHHDCSN